MEEKNVAGRRAMHSGGDNSGEEDRKNPEVHFVFTLRRRMRYPHVSSVVLDGFRQAPAE